MHLTQKYCRGVQTIELERIRGSVGRYTDFTSAFLPRRSHLRQRWERVKLLMDTQPMPPIEVYKVGEAYFVADGNHRVSAALHRGDKTIEATVCEFECPVGLSAEADLEEVLIKSEYADFLENTHLEKLRPGQAILFTSPGHYRELECYLRMFREGLEASKGEAVTDEQALLIWFDLIYSPLVLEIRNSGALERFPGRTEADLYMWIWQKQRQVLTEYKPRVGERVLQAISSLFRSVRRNTHSRLAG